jgi:hypothetical protein
MLELCVLCITFKSNYRAVQVVKLYVANVEALRKKERQVNLDDDFHKKWWFSEFSSNLES